MSEETAIEVVEGEIVRLGSLRTQGPADVIRRAADVATALTKIVDDQHLYTQIADKRHVHLEGWSTLGAMVGVMAREVRGATVRYEDGTYEASAELVRVSDGKVVGFGSAVCGMDEKDKWGNLTWAIRPEYARRSMAVTRAAGKAYRLAFSWIIALAGYSPTPAEEMVDGYLAPERKAPKPVSLKADPGKKVEPPKSNGGRPLSAEQVRTFFHRKLADTPESKHNQRITEGQVKLLNGKLNDCFKGEDDIANKRHSVLLYLFDEDSSKELTMAQASVGIDWLLEKPGSYELHPAVALEAHAVLTAALKEAGQEELFEEGEHPVYEANDLLYDEASDI